MRSRRLRAPLPIGSPAIAALLLGPILFACGDSAAGDGDTDREGKAVIDTLPDGAIRVHNAAVGVWDSASAWRFVEETRIGALEGDGPDVFAQVHDLAVDRQGRVWVLDRQQKRIEVFEPDGRHVRTVGRAGSGPGEFENPNGIEFDPAGRLWVQDPGNARFSVFDTAGALLATHRRESLLYSWRWFGGIARDGRIFDVDLDVSDETERSGRILVARDSTGVARDSFDLPRFVPEYYQLLNSSGRAQITAIVPFAPTLAWDVAPDGTFWFGVTDAYRLIATTLDSDTLRIVEREWTPVPVTQAQRDSAMELEFIRQIRAQGGDVDADRIPSNLPAWTAFWLDDEGYLWVRPSVAGDADVADVFDRDGVYLGRVRMPAGLATGTPSPVIRGDRFYGVVRDEFDVSYVVIGRLEGKDST